MARYTVELDSELGKKFGAMQLFINGTEAYGFLTILKHSEPFYGVINDDGICNLHGKIVTLIKETEYIATGKIDSKGFKLDLQLGKEKYELNGTAADNEEYFN